MFVYQDARGPVEVAFTDRHGGVSGGPFASLNLAVPPAGTHLDERPTAEHGADREAEEALVAENLDIVARAMARGGAAAGDHPLTPPEGVGVPVLVAMRQVHGADVHTVDRSWLADRSEVPTADGLVTDVPGVLLLVRVADCVPVLLADPEAGVVGVAHAGRAGLLGGVVPATVERMRDLGARELRAWVGPHVCGACYEVPEAMREEVAAVVPEARSVTSWGTPSLDLGAGVTAQLASAGAGVVDASRCTRESRDLYSHRRDGGAAGRLGGLVWVRP